MAGTAEIDGRSSEGSSRYGDHVSGGAFPDQASARGPHTPIFDQKGTPFFTLQSGHVGRIVPSTGEMKVSATPSANTYPYGIQVNSKGIPWYVDFRGNRVGSVDPISMQIKEFALPN